MWKAWLLSSLSAGIVVGLMVGASTSSFFFELLPGSGFYWFPVVIFLSGIIGSIIHGTVVQQFLNLPPGHLPYTTPGWIICHTIAWTMVANGVGFAVFLNWLSYQRSPSVSVHALLTYAVIGTVVGLLLGGIQLLFWRHQLRPPLLWLGLSWFSWVCNALLFAFAINFPYELGLWWFQGALPAWITFILTSMGVAIAWFVQAAIAGAVLVPRLQNFYEH